MADRRLENEILHGKFLAGLDDGEFWYWASAAGKERLKRRQEVFAQRAAPDMQILELGCGSGYFTEPMAEAGAHVTAIDISPDLIECARKRVPNENITFKVENAYQLNYENDYFDAVVGNSILHHLEMDQALNEVFRVLKPGKSICFLEPNLMNPLQMIELSTPTMRKLSRHSPDETAILRWKMKKLLIDQGFKDIQIAPFDFLHPNTPKPLVPFIARLGLIVEKIPIIREISGSLLISARKE